jgi:phage gpG-like protein
MAGIIFKINYKENLAIINSLNDKINNYSTMLKGIGVFLVKFVKQHFRDYQGSTAKWKELSPVTIKARKQGKKKSAGVQILRNKGTLLDSINRAIPQITDTSVTIGTAVPYAKYHDQPDNDSPTNTKANKIPKRDFMFISTNEKQELIKYIDKYIKGK